MRRAGPAARMGVVLFGVAPAALVACGNDEPERATDLAPSQISAETVPEPTSVVACDVDELSFEPVPAAGAADQVTAAVIRIGNRGPVRCEVNVADSPLADPLIEPDVWIEPGGQAELLVEHDGSTCDTPSPVTDVELRVNGSTVDVPVAVEHTCGVLLTAVYAVEAGE